jgi:hypothetical protein
VPGKEKILGKWARHQASEGALNRAGGIIHTDALVAGFVVQAVGFIDDESLEGIGRSDGEGTGADEEIGNAAVWRNRRVLNRKGAPAVVLWTMEGKKVAKGVQRLWGGLIRVGGE